MILTTVCNIYLEKCDVYIGRGHGGSIVDPPQHGCFGNPYSIEKFGRDRAIEQFKIYFNDRILKDEQFKLAVLDLRGKKLGCFCKPKNGFNGQLLCHGQIIAAWLNNSQPSDIS